MDDFSDIPHGIRLSNSVLKNRPVKFSRKPAAKQVLNEYHDFNQSDSGEQLVIYRPKPSSFERPVNYVSKQRQQDECFPEGLDPFTSRIFFVTSNNVDEIVESSVSTEPTTLWLDENFDDPSKATKWNLVSDEIQQEIDRIYENSNNRRCADCQSENPTIAIVSFLLIICEKCAAIHDRTTSTFLHLQPLPTLCTDSDFVELFHDYGNQFANSLLEDRLPREKKLRENSSEQEREEFIQKKYCEKAFVFQAKRRVSANDLNRMLFENVETQHCGTTLELIIQGADPKYSEKIFSVVDHAKRYQQMKQVKILLANGGMSQFDSTPPNDTNINQVPAFLTSRYGILKGFLTRYENECLKIYSLPMDQSKHARLLAEIELSRIVALYNQTVNAVPLRCRLFNGPPPQKGSQCTLIVDQIHSSNEYAWVFPDELERSVWIREFLQRQFSFYPLIYPDFTLLTQIHCQEGVNGEKQQMIAIIYAQHLVLCSDTKFDEIDLRKYSSLNYQKTREFTGIVLCLVNDRFLYLSSPILKLTDLLFTTLRQATTVKTLTELNSQILTSRNIPVIVENFVKFIFKYGLQTKGIFRQAGSETKIRQLLNECLENPFTSTLCRENYSEHDVASALKRFLRQLDPPLLGSRQNYQAWLRSTVEPDQTSDYLIAYYRGLLKELRQQFPIHYNTLRLMIVHLQTISMLSHINGMTMSNLVATFGPCLVSHPSIGPTINLHINETNSNESLQNRTLHLTPSLSLRRNNSFSSSHSPLVGKTSNFSLSSSYAHVAPSIESDLRIMANMCKYARQLFDITDVEMAQEEKFVETLVYMSDNPCHAAPLEGRLISVYFETRADELNGYVMNIIENETTADHIIETLLNRLDKSDCFFWALFEVIIDENLERPMYSCENIHEVLERYRSFLSHDLNRQATFVLKLNYLQFEKERLQQRSTHQDFRSVQCELFDEINGRWTPCTWIFQRAMLEIYQATNNANSNERNVLRRRSSVSSLSFAEKHVLLHSLCVDEIFLYVGADCRMIDDFDMNQYRVLTIFSVGFKNSKFENSPFGLAFRFADRNQMFSWYLELAHVNGHDKWTRDQAAHLIPNGISYLPLQNYHSVSSSKKSYETSRNKFIAKYRHLTANLCKPFKK